MTERHPENTYTISPHRVGTASHIDTEGYLQVGRSQRQPDSVTITMANGGNDD